MLHFTLPAGLKIYPPPTLPLPCVHTYPFFLLVFVIYYIFAHFFRFGLRGIRALPGLD